MGDSRYLTPPVTIWVAGTFFMMFVVDHISKGIGLLHACADVKAGSEVVDMLSGLPSAPHFFAFSLCVKTTNIIDITGMTSCIIAAVPCAIVLFNSTDIFPLKMALSYCSNA